MKIYGERKEDVQSEGNGDVQSSTLNPVDSFQIDCLILILITAFPPLILMSQDLLTIFIAAIWGHV